METAAGPTPGRQQLPRTSKLNHTMMHNKHMWMVACVAISTALATPLWAGADEPTLPETGVNIAREAGGWINVEASENRIFVRFFDAAQNPAVPDVLRGSARLVYPAREDHRVVLNRDGDALASPSTVRPPWIFRIHLVLVASDDGEPENFVLQYPGSEKS